MRKGSIAATVGAQYGDEGKAKVSDFLGEDALVIVRHNGGGNAGHTLKFRRVDGTLTEIVTHLLPAGIVRPKVMNVIARGVVWAPKALIQEMDAAARLGFLVTPDNLLISDASHITLPFHQALERAEERNPDTKSDTTVRAINPTYGDKARRKGVRAGELRHLEYLSNRVRAPLANTNALLVGIHGAETLSHDDVMGELEACRDRLLPFLGDEAEYLNDRLEQGAHILFEGAQAFMLDIDHGIWPDCTSSNTGPEAAQAYAGVSMRFWPTRVIAVVKAYISRVGRGHLVPEMNEGLATVIRDRAGEYGSTTGRPRRLAWFDCVVARHFSRRVRPTGLAITRVDILSGINPLFICTGYRTPDGRVRQTFPTTVPELHVCEPVLEEVPGWEQDIRGVTEWGALPKSCQSYLSRISAAYSTPLDLVSTGPERDETIVLT